MTARNDGRTLPWRIFHRTVRPYAFAVSLATAVMFASMLTESGVGEVLDSASGLAGEVHEHHIRPGVAA